MQISKTDNYDNNDYMNKCSTINVIFSTNDFHVSPDNEYSVDSADDGRRLRLPSI